MIKRTSNTAGTSSLRNRFKVERHRQKCKEESLSIDTSEMLFDNREEWLTTEEAAKYLRVSLKSLRNMTSNGEVPYYKLGGRNRYRVEDLRNLHTKKGGFYDR